MPIRDRGSIKWNSLMLPEHRGYLQKLLTADEKLPKPELDEQQLVRIERLLKKAAVEKNPVQLCCHRGGRFYCVHGRILSLNPAAREVVIGSRESPTRIEVDEIIDIKE